MVDSPWRGQSIPFKTWTTHISTPFLLHLFQNRWSLAPTGAWRTESSLARGRSWGRFLDRSGSKPDRTSGTGARSLISSTKWLRLTEKKWWFNRRGRSILLALRWLSQQILRWLLMKTCCNLTYGGQRKQMMFIQRGKQYSRFLWSKHPLL